MDALLIIMSIFDVHYLPVKCLYYFLVSCGEGLLVNMRLNTFIISHQCNVVGNHDYVYAGSNPHSTYPESSFCILKIDLEHSILP